MKFSLLVGACLIVSPVLSYAESASSIIQTMENKRLAREKGIDSFLVTQETAGTKNILYFEKDKGSGRMRLISPTEVVTEANMRAGGSPSKTKATMGGMAVGGEAFRQAFNKELGLPAGNPLDIEMRKTVIGMYGMYSALPTDREYFQEKSEKIRDTAQESIDLKSFGEMAELTGSETLNGKDAFVLKADGVNKTQRADGREFTIKTVSMWVDKNEYVPLRIRMDGVSKQNGEEKELRIEKDSQNYKRKSSLYLPFVEVMRISGIMTPEQQKQMKEAKEQIAQMEEQLNGPQGAMIKQMMAPQLKMLDSMAKGKGVEVTTNVKEVRVGVDRKHYVALLSQDGVVPELQ